MERIQEEIQEQKSLTYEQRIEFAKDISTKYQSWNDDRQSQFDDAKMIMDEVYMHYSFKKKSDEDYWKADIKLNKLRTIKQAKKAAMWREIWSNPQQMFNVRGTDEISEHNAKLQKASIVNSLEKMKIGKAFDRAIEDLLDIGEMVFITDWEERTKVIRRRSQNGFILETLKRFINLPANVSNKVIELPYYENARVKAISPFMFVFDHNYYEYGNKKQWDSCIKIYKRFETYENIVNNKDYSLTDEEKEKLRAEGRKPAIRFNIAKAQKAFHNSSMLTFEDLVKGELHMDTNLLGDFVIMKSNGSPTYNFAVVIDDMLMKISHVIRGEDHISNTFKQILIFEALGAEVPHFGHLGMILAPDRSKLSKRHGATAVSEFVEKGYLTDALINFVALLGWSPSDGQEIKTVDEIAQDFRIGEISSSNSIFEYDKLNWMNSHYIKMLPIEELKERLKPYLTQYDLTELSDEQYTRMVEVTREPLTLLSDITDAVPYFFGNSVEIEPEVQTDVLDTDVSQQVLKEFAKQAENWEFEEENLHEKLEAFRGYFKEQGIKPKVTMWAIRAAVTGRTRGADMTAILAILGKDKVLKRVNAAIKQTV